MNFVEINDFAIMNVGKTENELIITEDAMWDCIEKDGFVNKPIILNKEQELSDYRNKRKVNKFYEDNCIGYITGNIRFCPSIKCVTARVSILESFADRTHFDNWQIQYYKETGLFNYVACELFGEEELNNEENEVE
jgi:hypothetical protein